MRYIGIIILLVLCLIMLLFTGCMINTVTPEIDNGNLENQEDINQSSNNSQIVDTEEPGTVSPQKWATGDGTVENPWANNCLNSALTNCPAGGTIFLKAGYYALDTLLGIGKQINIIGEGMGKTIIVLGMTDTHGIRINDADCCTLKGFTVDGDSQTDGLQYVSPISVGSCDYALVEDIEVKNAGYYGINIGDVNYSTFQNIYAHDNYRHGLHPGSEAAGRNMYNIYRNIYAWNNGYDGFNDRGYYADPDADCYNIFDNIHCWENTRFGIAIGNQGGGVLSNSTTTGNAQRGMHLCDLKDFSINSCLATLNGADTYPGIYLIDSENINFTNVIIKNNDTGISIRNCSDIALTSCQSYDDRETPLQQYGLVLNGEGTNTNISLINCKLSPNKNGAIYNPNKTEIKQCPCNIV